MSPLQKLIYYKNDEYESKIVHLFVYLQPKTKQNKNNIYFSHFERILIKYLCFYSILILEIYNKMKSAILSLLLIALIGASSCLERYI